MRLRDDTQDAMVMAEVYHQNEYRLPDKFGPQDVIVDVGANIGAFALACLDRGAGRVICFEPDADNFAALCENLDAHPGAECHQKAMWRSDEPHATVGLWQMKPPLAPSYYTAQHFIGPRGPMQVDAIGLDDILVPLPSVRMLKLDCEGSEYPILFTSKELRRCDEIVGEAHDAPWMDDQRLLYPNSLAGVLTYLRDRHYEVWSEPNGGNAHFFAKRIC